MGEDMINLKSLQNLPLSLFLLASLMVLNILDTIITQGLVSSLGIGLEANPLMKWVIIEYGFGAVCFLKGMLIIALISCVILVRLKALVWINISLMIVNMVYIMPVVIGIAGLIEVANLYSSQF